MAGACSKDSSTPSPLSQLRKVTIKDAVMVYESEAKTRSVGSNSGMLAADENGNIWPVRFLTGQDENINVLRVKNRWIAKFSERYLLMIGSVFYKSDEGFSNALDDEFGPCMEEQYCLIVDAQTEYVYAFPSGIASSYDRYPLFMDRENNGYVLFHRNIYKVNFDDVNNLTLQPCLADGQQTEKYWVNANGVIYYEDWDGNSKFKCPGGRIYTFEELLNVKNASVFCGHSGDFYAAAAGNIYKIDSQGANQLQAEIVWKSDFYILAPDNNVYCPNQMKKTHITYAAGYLYVFNEETNELLKIEQNVSLPSGWRYCGWMDANTWVDTFVTSESLFVFSDDYKKLYQISLADYLVKELDLVQAGYEINPTTLSCSLTSAGLSFAGLRYADGKNVVGMINEDGTITANEKTATDTPIVSLVRLN